MNRKITVKNIVSNVIVQIVLAISGFILPKLILNAYGSTVNGMVNSIGQFLTYAGLVEMGVGNAVIVALYKPLARKDDIARDIILSTARKKYIISGFMYTMISYCLACVYPVVVHGQLGYSFVFGMILILATSGMIDYFCIGKYKVLLIADQKYYLLNFLKAISTITMTVASVVLLQFGVSLFWVKTVNLVTHIFEAIFIKHYVLKCYPNVNYFKCEKVELDQQGSSLLHQICATIVYNTDLVVLTLFLRQDSLKEVSVYTVYAMAQSMVKNLVSTLTTGINASFGNMIANDKFDEIKEVFSIYELIYFIILFSIYTVFIILIIPFVSCYTNGITDIEYIRYSVGILFGIAGLLSQLKDASGVVINGAGRYKETQKYAVAEAIVNVIVSVILVHKYGIIGVLIGTVFSHLVMDYGIIRYAEKVFLSGSRGKTNIRLVRGICIMIGICVIGLNKVQMINSWWIWLYTAVKYSCISCVTYLGANLVCEPQILKKLIVFAGSMIKKKYK